jgi:hypothetical protein
VVQYCMWLVFHKGSDYRQDVGQLLRQRLPALA